MRIVHNALLGFGPIREYHHHAKIHNFLHRARINLMQLETGIVVLVSSVIGSHLFGRGWCASILCIFLGHPRGQIGNVAASAGRAAWFVVRWRFRIFVVITARRRRRRWSLFPFLRPSLVVFKKVLLERHRMNQIRLGQARKAATQFVLARRVFHGGQDVVFVGASVVGWIGCLLLLLFGPPLGAPSGHAGRLIAHELDQFQTQRQGQARSTIVGQLVLQRLGGLQILGRRHATCFCCSGIIAMARTRLFETRLDDPFGQGNDKFR
mmetsp:Transcript_18544/g.50680  ORF Transcript_18544/g.50680 Transcript_18544/m.50680 type:complete len:266 (-) Transcript_18544:403-1200(-)